MLLPYKPVKVLRREGYDQYGTPQYNQVTGERCAVVHLIDRSVKTSVRADSSASRGASDEYQATAKLLFPKTSQVEVEDRIEVNGVSLSVLTREPRYTADGRLDHIEVTCLLWEKA